MSTNPIKFFATLGGQSCNFPYFWLSLNPETPPDSIPTDTFPQIQKNGILPIALGVSAVLTLGALGLGNRISEVLITLGKQSEEIFRGEQLPFLKFPRNEG